MKIDAFDLKILDALQQNNQITNQELAERINLSAASCARRVQQLRKDGVIAADVSVLAAEKLGAWLTIIVLVSVENEFPHLIEEFGRTMKDAPEVAQCLYVTGEVDFVVQLNVHDMSAYEAFTQRYFFNNKNIRRFQTLAVMKKIKEGMRLPIDQRLASS